MSRCYLGRRQVVDKVIINLIPNFSATDVALVYHARRIFHNVCMCVCVCVRVARLWNCVVFAIYYNFQTLRNFRSMIAIYNNIVIRYVQQIINLAFALQ